MFLKNGPKAANTSKLTDTPVQLQEFLDDVTFSNSALLGSCFPAPLRGKGWTHNGYYSF